MPKTELLYEGKAKKIWKTEDENLLIIIRRRQRCTEQPNINRTLQISG
jgi:phosphoribosylaminoimidazole-succinocarboxamide synthase